MGSTAEQRLSDYRRNLIVDVDNPVLAFKASRDRYAFAGPPYPPYAGFPYLGCAWSEDALTWSVFRWLQVKGHLDVIGHCLAGEPPHTVLFWGADCTKPGEEQFALGDLIRRVDGVRKGQVSEPDLVLIGPTTVHVVECKLGTAGQLRYRPWYGAGAKRFPDYQQWLQDKGVSLFRQTPIQAEAEMFYQLIRNAFYAVALAHRLNRTHASLTALVGTQPGRQHPRYPTRAEQIAQFQRAINPEQCEVRPCTWQEVAARLEERLGDFLPLRKLRATLQAASQA